MSETELMRATMTPREVVQELDKHIIGQSEAKRAVAIALRNRWRRLNVPEDLKEEILPKNILMIGPTGVGKTEIARRLARLAGAPFIKVEATKFTEVGYVGRDVESIIRDLVDVAIKQQRDIALEKVRHLATEAAVERILDILLPEPLDEFSDLPERGKTSRNESAARKRFREKLENGDLDEEEIEIETTSPQIGVEIMAPPGMEEMTSQLQGLFQSMGSDKMKKQRVKIKDAYKILKDDEARDLLDENEIKRRALMNVEENGIVFIDEIDKVVKRRETTGGDVSREGVQRDLLPLVEGSTVSTKYGMIKTNHILFIASGAFHVAKPSDLIAELQGRLPIRVELKSLSADDFERILTEPNASLVEQYTALMKTEAVSLDFDEKAIRRIAEVAWEVNDRTENIGARRLYTVMEHLLEVISFEATDRGGDQISIDSKYVSERLTALVKDVDLARYIL